MEFPLYNTEAKQVGTVELADGIFGLPMNEDLLYQVVTSLQANKRQIIAHAKGRDEVSGGGKKPWRQKGTGRARHGSIRSPIWRGGGVTHGPSKNKIYKKDINKKMLHKALRVALSSKARDGQLFIIDALNFETPKTKEMAAIMNRFTPVMGHLSNILLVMPGDSTALFKSARNLPYMHTVEARNLNPLTLLSANNIILSQDSLALIQKQWGDKSGKAPVAVKEAKVETKKAVARKAAKASPTKKAAKPKAKVSKKA